MLSRHHLLLWFRSELDDLERLACCRLDTTGHFGLLLARGWLFGDVQLGDLLLNWLRRVQLVLHCWRLASCFVHFHCRQLTATEDKFVVEERGAVLSR